LIDGVPAVGGCLAAFAEGGVKSAVVVTGAWAEEVENAVRGHGECRFAHNARFDEGMFSSVLTGLAAAEGDGAFIHPADIPLDSPSVVRKLAQAFRPGRWCVASFLGREEHPVLLPRGYFDDLRRWNGTLSAFLARHESEKIVVPVFERGVSMDMDTPQDLERLTAFAARRHVPDEEVVQALLDAARTPARVVLHQRCVAETALKIGRLFVRHAPIDLGLLEAAAKLHDIKKTEPSHAERGADFLEENGFPEVAEAVRGHTNLPSSATAETRVLYLADKYVNGTAIEPLWERETRTLKKFSSDKTALRYASRRIKTAFKTESAIEEMTRARPLILYLL
jgi:CTP:molybdopterin cytidylyltransferase MocA/HD superfamily phosphohydrolase YqeK